MDHAAEPTYNQHSMDVGFIKLLHYSKLPFLTRRMGAIKSPHGVVCGIKTSVGWESGSGWVLDEQWPLSLRPADPSRGWSCRGSTVWGLISGDVETEWRLVRLIRYGLFLLSLPHSVRLLELMHPWFARCQVEAPSLAVTCQAACALFPGLQAHALPSYISLSCLMATS